MQKKTLQPVKEVINQTPSNSNLSIKVAALLFVIFAIIILGAFYFGGLYVDQKILQNNKQIEIQNNKISRLINSKSQQINQVKENIKLLMLAEKKSKTFNRNQSEKLNFWKQSIQEKIRLTQNKIIGSKSQIAEDILYSEIEFLLNTAQLKLNLIGDGKAVKSLLEAADKRLRKISDVGVIKVREAIVSDKLKMEQYNNNQDLVTIFLNVEGISKYLSKVNLIGANIKLLNTKAKEEPSHLTGSIEKVLIKWFKISRSDKVFQPAFTNLQENIIRENTEIILHQIEFSLLKENNKLKNITLEKLIKYVNKYYNVNKKNRVFIDNQIKQIREYRPSIINNTELESVKVMARFTKRREEQARGLK